MGFISYEITVRVSPEIFNISRDEKTLSFTTKIYISTDHKRVLHISDGFVSQGEDYLQVELFKDDNVHGINKFDCLEAFVRIAFREIAPKMALIRPKVIFKGSKKLSGLLCGYQEYILEKSASAAGARICIFEK